MEEMLWKVCINGECMWKTVLMVNAADGFERIKSGRMISKWHQVFWQQDESPANHVIVCKGGKPSLSPFLDCNPDAKESILKNTKENLRELATDNLHHYIHTKVLLNTT